MTASSERKGDRMTKRKITDKPQFDPRLHAMRAEDDLYYMRWLIESKSRSGHLMPEGWIRAHHGCEGGPPKEKMTIRIDAEVLQWYRALGVGYQTRINNILRIYMDAVISHYIEDPVVYERVGPRT